MKRLTNDAHGLVGELAPSGEAIVDSGVPFALAGGLGEGNALLADHEHQHHSDLSHGDGVRATVVAYTIRSRLRSLSPQ